MVNKNSIYALNKKDPDAIVYPSANGKLMPPMRSAWSTCFCYRKNVSRQKESKPVVSLPYCRAGKISMKNLSRICMKN